jgi:hypothetical protein
MTDGKLANFDVVNAKHFLLFARPQLQSRDEAAQKVENGEDEAGAGKGVAGASKRVGNLVAQLHPVVVEEAAIDGVDAVEVRNVVAASLLASTLRWMWGPGDVRSEKGRANVAD